MTLRKLSRRPREAETLALLAATQPEGATTVDACRREAELLAELGHGLSEPRAEEARRRGWRVDVLFRAMMIELGEVQMVKEEDAGDVYFDDRDGELKLPDLRVAPARGRPVLVKVWEVGPDERTAMEIPRAEMKALRRYAEKQRARLLLAHYWSARNLWTLIDPARLDRTKGPPVVVPLGTAIFENEMGDFGDLHLATAPPLTMTLRVDPERPAPPSPARDGDGQAPLSIGAVECRAAGRLLEDPDERLIALAMMQLGKWEMEEEAEVADGRLQAIHRTWRPPRRASGDHGQEFEMVGTLSSIYSALFNLATLRDGRRAARLRGKPTPGGFAGLIPADSSTWEERALRLWCFEQKPARVIAPVPRRRRVRPRE